jgi:cellulose biosynthesis protein BcsQ
MQSIAVYSRKGGPGKSALTVFLAEFLASRTGGRQRVLVVDLDPQQSTSATILGDERLCELLQAGRSVTALIDRRLRGPVTADETTTYLSERPAFVGPGRFVYLGSIHLLASDREGWHTTNDRLGELARNNGGTYLALLREALAPLEGQFDVCLIDFPGGEAGPLVCCGLRAADRWLFPVKPDRMGVRDLDGTRRVLRLAYRHTARKIRGLGTVLSMCSNRGGGEYRKARAALVGRAAVQQIPRLFSKDAEIPACVEAQTALNEFHKAKTMKQRFGPGDSPFHTSLRRLTHEILERLRLPVRAEETIDAETPANDKVGEVYSS